MVYCKRCGTKNESNHKFCENCGTKLDSQESSYDKFMDRAVNIGRDPIYCRECNSENTSDSQFCQVCGSNLVKNVTSEIKDPKKKFIKDTALALGFWGVINLLFAPAGGVILVFFAILIYASSSIKAILAFGIVWLIVASIQLLLAIEVDAYLIIFAIINLAVAGYFIYKSRQYAD